MIVIKIEPQPPPWKAIAAFSCFVGALLALAVGSLLTTAWLLDAGLHPILHALGLILLILGLPMLILGGHCLDLLEREQRPTKSGDRGVSCADGSGKQQSVRQ
jgi:hypothetical protein